MTEMYTHRNTGTLPEINILLQPYPPTDMHWTMIDL